MDLKTKEQSKKRVLLTGGTGFIGKKLVQTLLKSDHEVTVLTRNVSAASDKFAHNIRFINNFCEITDDTQFDVIINLAGESLANGRWNKERKDTFIQSRLTITADICDLIKRLEFKPEVLINGSAIGYYGPHQDEVLNETGDVVDCFAHTLCKQWENKALEVEALGVRVCLLRIGIVLGDDGGPFVELKLPYTFGFSMQISAGKQWMSWIHRDDLIAIILFAMNEPDINGPINGTAPNPVTNKGFADVLSLHVKTIFRIKFPAKLLSIIVGELADEVLITGQHVIPEKVQKKGFVFTYPELSLALTELVGPPLK